jgi:hypothetical protein
MEHRGKFDSDQKNCETELARKRAVEEQERVDAANNRKILAESSIKLVECMESMASSSDTNIDEKLGQMKEDIMQKMDEKLDSKFDSFFCQHAKNDRK